MITRRNIRIKVMQVLYQLETNETIANPEGTKILLNRLDQTARLFAYLIYFLTEVARYAERDAAVRASKHLATSEDKNISIKLAGNTLLWKILENRSYKKAIADYKFNFEQTGPLVRRVFQELTGSELYKEYLREPGRDARRALLARIRSCRFYEQMGSPVDADSYKAPRAGDVWDFMREIARWLDANAFDVPGPEVNTLSVT